MDCPPASFASGELVQFLPIERRRRYQLYAFHPFRHLPPAKVRAFLEFALASIGEITNDHQRRRDGSE